MEASAKKNRLSPAVAGWIVGGLFVGMLVLLFWPAPKDPPPPPLPEIKRPPSELTKVGLPDDPDLEGLPGFFAVWADHAEWRDNKTIFAYKHPVSGEFSFFFEATRTDGGYRFRPIEKPREQDLNWLTPPADSSPVALLLKLPPTRVPARWVPPPVMERAPKAVELEVNAPRTEPSKDESPAK